MNNAIFGKTMENLRKCEILNLSQQKMPEQNYHTTKLSAVSLWAIKWKKFRSLNKPVYLGLLILELSKILMYEFWHDYIKPKYGEIARLCYLDTYKHTYIYIYIYIDIYIDRYIDIYI